MTPNSSPIAEIVLEQAADWLVLIHSGEMDETKTSEYLIWLAEHPDHQKAIERVEKFTSGFLSLPQGIDQNSLLNSQKSFNSNLAQKFLFIFAPLIIGSTLYCFLPWDLWRSDYSTHIGEVKTIHLDDGTALTLASNSYVNVYFDQNKRKVELLKGELYIQTAKEELSEYRPFFVDTINGRIQALGTRFSIRNDHQHTCTKVKVYEHRVEILPFSKENHQQIIHQGEQIKFNQQYIDHVNQFTGDQPYWLNHMLVVEDWTLNKVLSEIYRYRHGTFILDPHLQDIKVSGVFSLKNPEQSIETLAKTYDLKVEPYTKYLLHIKK